MSDTIAEYLSKNSSSGIDQVDFFKRDELTTDLVCCEIKSDSKLGSSMRNVTTGKNFLKA